MFAIDEIVQASPAKAWPPMGKLFLTAVLLVASLLSNTILVPLISIAIGLGLLFFSTSFPPPRFILFALSNAILAVAVGAIIIAALTAGNPIYTLWIGSWAIVFTEQGVSQAIFVFLRSTAGIIIMLFFATSMPIPHLAYVLCRLRIPKEIIELVVLIYRYSFLVLEQAEAMFLAARCRLGFRGFKNSIRTFSQVAVGMFIRAMDVVERSQVALDCRNFQGDFPLYRDPVPLTVSWFILPIILFIFLYLANLIHIGALI